MFSANKSTWRGRSKIFWHVFWLIFGWRPLWKTKEDCLFYKTQTSSSILGVSSIAERSRGAGLYPFACWKSTLYIILYYIILCYIILYYIILYYIILYYIIFHCIIFVSLPFLIICFLNTCFPITWMWRSAKSHMSVYIWESGIKDIFQMQRKRHIQTTSTLLVAMTANGRQCIKRILPGQTSWQFCADTRWHASPPWNSHSISAKYGLKCI